MVSKRIIAVAAGISSVSAATYQGFNYGAETNFGTEFALAKSLAGTNGAFASARLYTSIEQGTANTPSSAFQAAISNDVTLLLGIWGSAGQGTISNEIAAIQSAISQLGTAFTSRVVGISVGSEDLYRNSPTGIINKSGIGANPADIVSYIGQVRQAFAGTPLAGIPIGHVDTWTAWVNGSNFDVTSACDFIGVDAYPYFQNTQANAINSGYDLFFSAYDQTVAVSQGKPVWVTETGWPASGPSSGDAIPSTANAETYWKAVACKLLGTTNTWWYTLNDNGASPSFGVTTGSSTPLYDLSCNVAQPSSSSSTTVTQTSSTTPRSSSTTPATSSTTPATTTLTSSVTSSSISSAASTSSNPGVSLTSQEATATPSNSIVPVTSSAIATQLGGGSPGVSSSAGLPVNASSSFLTSSVVQSTMVVLPTTGNLSTTSGTSVAPSATGSASSLRSSSGLLIALLAMFAAL